ncbi:MULTISPECIES: hypothetical protein [Filomicrobium]|uniref:hypothetical protein n=1 Tax=Filomicrobium TaxID=119044 RepID=UPI0006269765|nr:MULTISPECIES: hypothetical protein [Filomicrobium]MCV0369757.1 hypothetical protein [Filomicrobium sp.]
MFCLIVSLVGAEPGPAVPQFSDLIAISANASEIGKVPDQAQAAAKAAEVVKVALPVTQSKASSLLLFVDQRTAMWMLAAIFSGIFAFNLTFLRYLRRQHAPVRIHRRRLR